LLRSLYARVEHLRHEMAKFASVGAVAYVVDIGTFNLLLHAGGERALLHNKTITANVIATVVATAVAFIGNRHWTWKHRDRSGMLRETTIFGLVNVVGLLITSACLGFSRYVLDLNSPLADNISGKVIGIGLAMMFRFYAYRRWVFPAVAEDTEDRSPELKAA